MNRAFIFALPRGSSFLCLFPCRLLACSRPFTSLLAKTVITLTKLLKYARLLGRRLALFCALFPVARNAPRSSLLLLVLCFSFALFF